MSTPPIGFPNVEASTMKEYITNTFGNTFQSCQNAITFCWGNYIKPTYHYLIETYSLRGRTKYVQELAAMGKAKKIETMQAYDPSSFPKFIKKIHIVVDPNSIKKGLGNREMKEKASPYPSELDQLLERNNMLLCPYSQHRRLRSPAEISFSKKEIAKFTSEFVKIIIKNFIFADLLDNHLSRRNINFFTKSSERSQARSISNNCIAHVLGISKDYDLEGALEEYPSLIAKSLLAAEEKNSLSQEESTDTFNLLYLAGRETTHRSLSFLFEQMSIQPHVIDKIKEEWEIFQHTYPCKNLEDLPEKLTLFALGGKIEGKEWPFSPWLNACVKEILRLYPAVTEIRRVAQEECILEGTSIKADDIIIYDIFAAQRNAKVWQAPSEFHPERFLEDTRSVWQSHEPLLNFSVASKRCLGQDLAKLELLLCCGLYAIFAVKLPYANEKEDAIVGCHSLSHSFSEIGFLQPEFPDPTGKMLCGLGLLKKYSFAELTNFSKMSFNEIANILEIYESWDRFREQRLSPEATYRFFMELDLEEISKINYVIKGAIFSLSDILSLNASNRSFFIKNYIKFRYLLLYEPLAKLMNYSIEDREFLMEKLYDLKFLLKRGISLSQFFSYSVEDREFLIKYKTALKKIKNLPKVLPNIMNIDIKKRLFFVKKYIYQ